MKVTSRFMTRAALVLTTGGVIGFAGACKDSTPPPPPPPPGAPAAPSGLAAVAVGADKINLTWTDNANNETGFRVDRCTGAGCTNFAQIGTNLAANTTTYSDAGLTATTQYSYRVRAFGATAADTSTWSAVAGAETGSVGGSASFTLIGAGEITNCATTASIATAGIIKPLLSDPNVIVFTAGNNLTDTMPNTTYDACFAPKWGEFKDRTYYAIGNGDYMGGRGVDGVHAYLGDRTIPKGSLGRSFDKGNWHIIILNSGDWEQSKEQLQDPNGPMNAWLATDLSTVPASKCILAISWERRIYTTGTGTLGLQFNMKQAASILFAAGADVLVSAKDKVYARFPQTDNDGVPNALGFRQFLVGTGGRSLDQMITPAGSPVEAQNGGAGGSNGVIKFTLNDNSYEWEFIPTLAGGYTDKSTAPVPCHQ